MGKETIDGTDIIRSIPAIGRPLRFPMDIALASLPMPVDDAAKAVISYIRQVSADSRLAKQIVMWLTLDLNEKTDLKILRDGSIIQVFIDRKYLASCDKLYLLLMNYESIWGLMHRKLKKLSFSQRVKVEI